MNLHENHIVSIHSQGMIFNPIAIRKGVKQGCTLSPLLFSICINTLFGFLERKENQQYSYTKSEFPVNLLQA
jgi:hypothetical protein